MIIFRYLTREIIASLCAVTGILLLIFLSNQFIHYLNQAASGKFAGNVLVHLMAIEIPHLLAVLLPLGLFLGILLAYGRLYSDNEITVLTACGLSRSKLIALTLPLTLVITIIVAMLTLWLNPKLLVARDQMIMQTGTALALETTLPGQFRESDDGKKVLYIESVSPRQKLMKNVFFAQHEDNVAQPTWTIATAQSGYETTDIKTHDPLLVATKGYYYKGLAGNKDFQITKFGSYTMEMGHQAADLSDAQETFSTAKLLTPANKTERMQLLTEFEWRLSLPFSAILLMLLAIPLSKLKPRQHRYTNLLPAILIYATYVNLLLFARNWVMDGIIPLYLGLWWIHALLLLVTALIWINQTGWRTTWNTLTARNTKIA